MHKGGRTLNTFFALTHFCTEIFIPLDTYILPHNMPCCVNIRFLSAKYVSGDFCTILSGKTSKLLVRKKAYTAYGYLKDCCALHSLLSVFLLPSILIRKFLSASIFTLCSTTYVIVRYSDSVPSVRTETVFVFADKKVQNDFC